MIRKIHEENITYIEMSVKGELLAILQLSNNRPQARSIWRAAGYPEDALDSNSGTRTHL